MQRSCGVLSITRKQGQSFLLSLRDGVDPKMTVAELFKDGPMHRILKAEVRIGIQAPRELLVLREELVLP